MNKHLKVIIVLLLVIATLVGCGNQKEEKEKGKEEDTIEVKKAEEKKACLKLVKEACKIYEEENIGPFSQAICRRSGIITNLYFEDTNHYVYSTMAYKSAETGKETLSIYNRYNNSIAYDKGLCENEESLSAIDQGICSLAKYAREDYDKYLEKAKDEIVEYDEYYYFLFKENEFK